MLKWEKVHENSVDFPGLKRLHLILLNALNLIVEVLIIIIIIIIIITFLSSFFKCLQGSIDCDGLGPVP